jgi:hypothetical protein
MEQQVDSLRAEALAQIASATDAASLEAVRLKYLGKSGAITALYLIGVGLVALVGRPRLDRA